MHGETLKFVNNIKHFSLLFKTASAYSPDITFYGSPAVQCL